MRLHACSDRFENGRVFLPANAPWLDEYLLELVGFPGTEHDDQVELNYSGVGPSAGGRCRSDLPQGVRSIAPTPVLAQYAPSEAAGHGQARADGALRRS